MALSAIQCRSDVALSATCVEVTWPCLLPVWKVRSFKVNSLVICQHHREYATFGTCMHQEAECRHTIVIIPNILLLVSAYTRKQSADTPLSS